jgi:fido (protein-threonine AMPylation protein)
MATKYDCFELLYKKKSALSPRDIAQNFSKENYITIYKQLIKLVEEDLIEKKDSCFEIKLTKKTELLYQIIEFCLKNEINYNDLIDFSLVKFIKECLEKKEINSASFDLNSRTLRKYISILNKYELDVVISEKPLRFKVFYNTLINNLILYLGFKTLNVNQELINYLPEIQKELLLFRKLRKKNERRYLGVLDEIQIPFIHHSLSMEGNPVTLLNTFKILKDEIVPKDLRVIHVEEIRNYKEAIKRMINDVNQNIHLNLNLIIEYQKLAMRHRASLAGKIRDFEVHIKGNPDFKITPLENIFIELELLIDKYNLFLEKEKGIGEIIDFAVNFHNSLQHIHPFEDGNSRTTRLVTFSLFQRENIPIMDIPFGLLDEYLANTKGSKKREDYLLEQTFQKMILFNLKSVNRKLSSWI